MPTVVTFCKTRTLSALLLVALSSTIATAATTTFSTATGATNGGESVDASAMFTTNANGSIDIVLSNLLTAAQVHSVGGDISDLMFTISNSFSSTVSDSNRSYSGTLINVDGSGNVTPGSGSFDGWDFSNSGSNFTLEELGSVEAPSQTIVGGAGATSYPNANASIDNGSHDPFLQGSATFHLTGLTGITSSTTITAVTFSFGTMAGGNVPGHNNSSVPEPKATSALLLGCLAAFAAWRRKKAVAQ
jgi:hypothetical protein